MKLFDSFDNLLADVIISHDMLAELIKISSLFYDKLVKAWNLIEGSLNHMRTISVACKSIKVASHDQGDSVLLVFGAQIETPGND